MSKQKSVAKKEITKDTPLAEIIYINPKAPELLFDIGLHCIGCSMSGMETLEEGCLGHGMSKKEINELVKRLNAKWAA